MTTPSTEQSTVDAMADLVMAAPGERVAIMGLLHQAIHDRMVAAGMTDDEISVFWVRTILDIENNFVMSEFRQGVEK